MRRCFFLVMMSVLMQRVNAQVQQIFLNEPQSEYISVFKYWKEHNIFQHLDLSLTAGTTGIGLEVSSPITDLFQLRAGFDIMPRFTRELQFGVTIGGEPAANSEKFARMSSLMKDISGYDIEDHVDMIAKPTMHNFKLLVDIFPFKYNRHWHFTAGIYWGPKTVAVADNSAEAMKSLLSVGMYNRMYTNAVSGKAIIDFEKLAMDMGMTEDEAEEFVSKYHLNIRPDELYNRIINAGRLGFYLGYFTHDMIDDNGVEHKKDERYNYEPGADGMVHVTAKANSLKPYLGFGYGGRLFKGCGDWHVSFDAGILIWGGSPGLYTQDGVDIVRDVHGITDQVAEYIDLSKKFKAYPVLNLKITKRIF